MNKLLFALLILVCIQGFARSPNECRDLLSAKNDPKSFQACLKEHDAMAITIETAIDKDNSRKLILPFSKEHFGKASTYFSLWKLQSLVQGKEYGRAVLEMEPIILSSKKDLHEYANIRSFLFRNSEFATHLFRATEAEGIDYYSCVFGISSAKIMLKARLDHFGDALPLSQRDLRLQSIENLQESSNVILNEERDCTQQRIRFTEIWSQEIDSIYLADEQAIRKRQMLLLAQIKDEALLAIEKAEKIKKENVVIREKLRPYNLAISDVEVFKYGSSTGFRISALNLSNKNIKYLNFTVVGINAVGDAVVDRLKGKRMLFRGIGPIKPGENVSYSENIMWFTDVVDKAKIDALTIEYMDGTKISVKSPMRLLLSNQDIDILTSQ